MAGPYQKIIDAPGVKLRRRAAVIVAGFVAGVGCSGRSRDAGPSPTAPPVADQPAATTVVARPLDRARLDALAQVVVAGRTTTLVRRGERDLAAEITTAAPGDRALVTVSACLGCVPMDRAAWRARAPELAALWAPRGAGAGDQLAIDAVTVAGTTGIEVRASRGDGTRVDQLHQLHWNDGATQLVAWCEASAPVEAGPPPCAATAAAAFAAYLTALTTR